MMQFKFTHCNYYIYVHFGPPSTLIESISIIHCPLSTKYHFYIRFMEKKDPERQYGLVWIKEKLNSKLSNFTSHSFSMFSIRQLRRLRQIADITWFAHICFLRLEISNIWQDKTDKTVDLTATKFTALTRWPTDWPIR